MMLDEDCILCHSKGGILLVQTKCWHLVRATDQDGFPLTYRVIWNEHKSEFSDLSIDEQMICMKAVSWVEKAIRQYLKPDKVNLAALGNMVAHLHWHIIPRYQWDSRFPSPVWASPVREVGAAMWEELKPQQLVLEEYLKSDTLNHG